MEEEGAKSVAITLYGVDLATAMAKAAGHKGKLNWRKILEPVDAVTQCNRTIEPFKNDIICYICGFPIPTKDGKTSDHELYPECEHILPVTQARWFLELYTGDPTKKSDYNWLQDAFKSEYAYAHRVCNQAKSMDSFFSEIGQQISPDKNKIKEILTKIKNRAKNDLSSGKYEKDKLLTAIRDMNIDNQLNPGSTLMRRLSSIQQKVNIYPEGQDNLLVLARTSIITDPNVMVKKVQDVMVKQGNEFIRLKKIRKELTLDFINRLYEEIPELSPSNIGKTLFESRFIIEQSKVKEHSTLPAVLKKFGEEELPRHIFGILENWKIIYDAEDVDPSIKNDAALQIVLLKIWIVVYTYLTPIFPKVACNLYHTTLEPTRKGIMSFNNPKPPDYIKKIYLPAKYIPSLPQPVPDINNCPTPSRAIEALALKRMTNDEFQKVLNDSEYTKSSETAWRIMQGLSETSDRSGGKHRKTRRKQKRRLTRKRTNKSR